MVWESLIPLAGTEGIEKDMETTIGLRSRSYGLGFRFIVQGLWFRLRLEGREFMEASCEANRAQKGTE